MKYTIRIFELNNKSKLQELVQVILKQKTLTMKEVIEGLQKPPLNVPVECSPEYIINLKDTLKSLGATLKVVIQDANQKDGDADAFDLDEDDFGIHAETHATSTGRNIPSFSVRPTQKVEEELVDGSTVPQTIDTPPKYRFTPSKKKPKGLSKPKQLLILSLFVLPFIILILLYDDNEKSTPKIYKPGEVKVVTTALAPLTGDDKAHELYLEALQTNNPEKTQELLSECLKENPYHDKAWDEIIKSYEKNGDYGYAKKAREEKFKKSTSVKRTIQAIALEINRRNSRFTIDPSLIEMDLSHTRSKALFQARAQEIYLLLNEKHPGKKITFINKTLNLKIDYTSGSMKIQMLRS